MEAVVGGRKTVSGTWRWYITHNAAGTNNGLPISRNLASNAATHSFQVEHISFLSSTFVTVIFVKAIHVHFTTWTGGCETGGFTFTRIFC
jgi:hypothetical protein